MARHTKVLEITDSFNNLVCIRDNETRCNPYLLYLLYPAKDKYGYPTMHRKKLVAYADMASVICHIRDMYLFCGFPYKGTGEILEWNKKYCGK